MNYKNKDDLLRSIMAAVAIMVSGLIVNAGPVIAGAFAEGFSLDIAEIGNLLSLMMLASGITMIALIFILKRLSPKKVMGIATTGLICANLPMLHITDYHLLMSLFVIQGIATGFIYSTAMALLGESDNQDRAYGISQLLQIIGAAAMVYIVPVFVFPFYGYQGVVIFLVVANCTLYFTLKSLPNSFAQMEEDQQQATIGHSSVKKRLPSFAGLLALFLCNGAITGIWMFAERMGTDLNVTPNGIGLVLAVSVVISLMFTAVPIFMGDRLGRTLPTILSISTVILGIAFLTMATEILGWGTGIVLLELGWAVMLPYLFAQIADSDPTGKIVVIVPPVVGLSMAAGVSTVGQLFDGNYNLAYMATVGALLVGAALFLYSNHSKINKDVNSNEGQPQGDLVLD